MPCKCGCGEGEGRVSKSELSRKVVVVVEIGVVCRKRTVASRGMMKEERILKGWQGKQNETIKWDGAIGDTIWMGGFQGVGVRLCLWRY